MRKLNFALFFMLLSVAVHAQMMNPVHFKTELKALDDATAEILFTATIDNGWHVYSTDLGQDGPIEATFNTVKLEGAELVGKLQPRGKVTEQFDQMFGMTLRFFEKKGTFVQKIRFTKPKYTIDAYLEYGACNDEMCMPPTQVAFKAAGNAPVVSGKDDAKTDDIGIEPANDEKESTDSVVSE